MTAINRRALLAGGGALGAAALLGGCQSSSAPARPTVGLAPRAIAPSLDAPASDAAYALMYGPVTSEPFPIAAIDVSKIPPQFLRREVADPTGEAPGAIVVDPYGRFLYHVHSGGRATRYGVGVGKQGFEWSGDATIQSKQHWPDWYPPAEMIARRPDLKPQLTELQSGQGVAGGPRNPLGARAMYLWQGGKDTLFRIHGTIEPYSIGTSVSSGCIRMINQDAIDLYERVPLGSKVVVLS